MQNVQQRRFAYGHLLYHYFSGSQLEYGRLCSMRQQLLPHAKRRSCRARYRSTQA